MPRQPQNYSEMLQQLAEWMEKTVETVSVTTTELVKKAGEFARAAEELTEEEVALLINSFKRDMESFQLFYERDMKQSIMIENARHVFWQALYRMTDKSQVEWMELEQDFQHGGKYLSGELVGFGLFDCNKCHHELVYNHPDRLIDCPECGGTEFSRHPLSDYEP